MYWLQLQTAAPRRIVKAAPPRHLFLRLKSNLCPCPVIKTNPFIMDQLLAVSFHSNALSCPQMWIYPAVLVACTTSSWAALQIPSTSSDLLRPRKCDQTVNGGALTLCQSTVHQYFINIFIISSFAGYFMLGGDKQTDQQASMLSGTGTGSKEDAGDLFDGPTQKI